MSRRPSLPTLLSLLSILLITSCKLGGYESGDGPNSYLNSSLGELQTNSEAKVASLLLDNGSTVALSEQKEFSGAKADTVYRGLIYYTSEGSSTTLTSFKRALVCPLVKRSEVKNFVQDPLDIESAWVSADKRYLNLTLLTKIGTVTDGGRVSLTLVLDRDTTMLDGHTHHYISLYHNQSTVPEYYTEKNYLSLPCNTYFSKGDSITINWTDTGKNKKTTTLFL